MHFLYQSPIGLVQAALNGDITMMNPMAAQLLLPPGTEPSATNLFDILDYSAPELKALLQAHGQCRGMICDSLRIDWRRKDEADGDRRVLAVSLVKLGDTALAMHLTDVTAEIQLERRAVASAANAAPRIDSLTELPNRTAILEKLADLRADANTGSGRRFALLAINCDRFSHVNDIYGRSIGDALLKLLAGRLSRAVRQGDLVAGGKSNGATAAHLGGDEFVVVLTGLDAEDDGVRVGKRLLEILAEAYWIGGKQYHVTVSIGVVSASHMHAEGERILQDAYLAMNDAKRSGRARLGQFEPAMRARATHRGVLEDELREAIAKGELFVVYQPVMDLQQGRVSGVEALVRWKHPERGLVYPQEFIEIAEETNLICDLGSFVLEEACRRFALWKAEMGSRAPRKLSVNLSRAQMLEPDLAGQVAAILKRTGFDPADLMLEITESLAVTDDRVQKCLMQLKALKVTIALDDFGVGYSSLSSLHLLPVDVIKIDRSFVMLIEQSKHHQVLVDATVKVARSLGMRTIAEGIETAGQLALLTALQCDEGQGYLFSKPLPDADVGEWLLVDSGCRHSAA